MPVILGDLDNDGKLTTKDLTIMNSYINGINEYSLTDDQIVIADLNNDGIVDSNDLTFGINYLANNNSADEYFDATEISGEFKIRLFEDIETHYQTGAGNIINDIIKNTDGSFTNLTKTEEIYTNDTSEYYTTVTINFTYDTTNNFKSNDGLFLAGIYLSLIHI